MTRSFGMSDRARTTGRLGKFPSDIDADGLLATALFDGIVGG